MDERKKQVLHAIINDYITTAEPVGSRVVAKKYNLGVSPATIRNEMAGLEDLGYIEQPHTSAGRRPSNKGYRYYVNTLMQKKDVEKKEAAEIKQLFSRQLREIDSFMRYCCQIISRLTNYTTIVSVPHYGKGCLERIQLVLLDSWRVMLIMLSTNGQVSSRVIVLSDPMTEEQIAVLEKMLQDKLQGLDMNSLTHTILREVSSLLDHRQGMFSKLLESMEMILMDDREEKVFTSGTMNMLMQPEFKDTEKLKNIFSLLEEEGQVRNLLELPSEDATSVVIGDENVQEDIQDCSLVVTSYRGGGQRVGSIGVLGPTRMSYGRAISLLEFIAEEITRTLDKGKI
ncbi:MAG: heat-inducible transcriptional repressor HrcA [Bacillota bacterium]|jgi:heat-inducible transcriptional repressor